MIPRIVRLDADPQDYVISAVFETGETRQFNVRPLLDRGVFRRIRNRKAFASLHIDELGSVVWDSGPDLCRDTIYLEGSYGLTGIGASFGPNVFGIRYECITLEHVDFHHEIQSGTSKDG